MTTNFNKAPYYDDYSDKKKFLKILFHPSRAVQGRELTQIQSSLQNQIGKFGSSIYKNGSKVLDAQIAFESGASFVKITATDLDLTTNITNFFRYFNIDNDIITVDYLKSVIARQGYMSTRDGVVGKTFFNGESAIRVVAVYPPVDVGNPATIIGKKMSGAALLDNAIYTDSVSGTTFTTNPTASFGDSSFFTVNNGVFFVNNYFVYCDKQTIVTSKYSGVANTRAGLFISESVITHNEDQSLLDPARQTTNFTAIGADRYTIDLQLQTRDFSINPIENVSDVDFVELVRIENGIVTNFVKYPYYSDLEDTLARRTYDESGNYTVTSFAAQLREHPTDNTKFQFGLDAGKAYINGYEFETISTNWLDIEKARETNIVDNEYIPTNFGNYVYADSGTGTVTGILPTTTHGTVDLYDATVGGSIIGNAKVRMVYKESATKYRIYLIDVVMIGVAVFSSSKRIQFGTARYDLLLESGMAVIKDPSSSSLVFSQPYNAVKTVTETQYNYLKTLPVASNVWTGAGPYTVTNISASTNESFIGVDGSAGYAPYTIIDSLGVLRVITNVTVAAGIATITISAGVGAPGNSTLYGPVSRNLSVARTKTLNTQTVSVACGVGVTSFNLTGAGRNFYDIYSLESVKHSSDLTTEIKQKFTLNDGINDNYYGVGSVKWTDVGAVNTTGTFQVTFKSFDHSNDATGSGYFTVDSYNTVPYSDVKTYFSKVYGKTYNLTDIVDFRATITDTIGSTTVKNQSLPIPFGLGSEYTSKIEFYLPRKDKIILSRDKIFSVVKGTSGIPPQEPEAPNGTMSLYVLDIPSYTFKALDVTLNYIENKRYTMGDIGKIDRRVNKLEYYVALSLLEKQAADSKLLNGSGNIAFKNGILVDSFSDHSVGNVNAIDYRCSVDPDGAYARPMFESRLYTMGRTAGVEPSIGGLVTLPYTTEVFVNQPLGSKYLNVNPYDVVSWNGGVTLSPSSDSWLDTQTLPEIVKNVNVDTSQYINTTLSFGTVFGAWKQNMFVSGSGLAWEVSRSQTSVTTALASTTTTSVLTSSVIPYMRQIPISFSASGMQPNTVVYAFFDDKRVRSDIVLKTDWSGSLSNTFTIPENVKTGTRLFRVIDNLENNIEIADTSAMAQFAAAGTLLTTQSTRINNIKITTNTVFDYSDPLAQTFLVPTTQYPEGIVIDSVDLFFGKKDANLPVTLEIRPTVNGFPSSTESLPLSTVTLVPDDVNVIANLKSPNVDTEYTRFSFPSPILLLPGEYAVVVMANSQFYEVMCAGMGEIQLGAQNVISKQPYAGSLFKSQNASTWTPSQDEDLSFRVNKCVFPVGSPQTVTFKNIVDDQTDNFKYHLMYTKPQTIIPTSSAVAWEYRGKSTTGVLDAVYSPIQPLLDTVMTDEKRLLGTTVGELEFVATMSTSNKDMTPFIDIDRMGVILVKNIVNTGYVNETTPSSGTAAAKYITKPVSLNAGFESTGLNITFDAYLPGIADVEVWFKAINSGSGSNLDTALWTKINLTGIVSSDLISDVMYREYNYNTGNTISMFNQYAIKLVFSGDGINYPQVKNLRVIAYE